MEEPRLLGLDDLRPAAELLGRAFYDDPLLVYALPDPVQRRALAADHFEPIVRLSMLAGEVWRAQDAVACWCPPGSHQPDQEELVASGLDRMPELIGAEGAARLEAVFAHLEERRLALAVPDHWYLSLLGTEPGSKGQGQGGRAVAPVLTRSDESGVPSYLETMYERNTRFYERLGFQLVEHGKEPTSGLDYWLYLRQAVTRR